MEKITQGNVLKLWADKHEEVKNWLNHLQEKELNAFGLYRFCEWASLQPEELLEEKAKHPSENKIEKVLDKFCGSDDKTFTNSFRYQASIAVKSFFRWNYRDLAKASGAVTLEKVKPYNALNKEVLRKLWSHAHNLRDRAIVPFICSTAIAKETLSEVTWSLLEENWETKDTPCIQIPAQLLKGHGIGRYKNVQQITFLTGEAKAALLDYKAWLEKRLGRKVKPNENIWRSTRVPYEALTYETLGMLITRLAEEAGVDFSCHDARRWVNTGLESTGISPNWAKKIRGRKVKGEEAPYSRPAIEQLRDKFREAVPVLEFTSDRPQVPKEVQERMAALEAEQLELRQKYRFRRAKETEKCEDGEHCQKIVAEENLPNFLSQNWRVVASLPSGKVVIES